MNGSLETCLISNIEFDFGCLDCFGEHIANAGINDRFQIMQLSGEVEVL